MTIEDVDYLIRNSTQDNFILHIDSALRERDYYPNPNSYVVTFDEPFKYVYGIDILDVSIPSTMFNVDVNNNVLRAGVYTHNNFVTRDALADDDNNLIIRHDFEEVNSQDLETLKRKIDLEPLLNELYAIEGFERIMADIHFIPGLPPYTYKILVTSPASLTWAYNNRTIRQPPQDQIATFDFDVDRDTYLRTRHMRKLFYSQNARGSQYLQAVRSRLLRISDDFVILTEEQAMVLVNGASPQQTFYKVGEYTYAVEAACKFVLYSSSSDYVQSGNPAFLQEDDATEDILARNNGLKTVPQLRQAERVRLSALYPNLSNAEIEAMVPRFIYFFVFTHKGTTYYIRWVHPVSQDEDVPENIHTLVKVIEEGCRNVKASIIEKLDLGPLHTYSLRRAAGRSSFEVYWFFWIPMTVDTFEYDPTVDQSQSSGSYNGFNTTQNSKAFYLYLGLQYFVYNPGNYGITNFLTETKRVFNNSDIDIDNALIDDITIRPQLRFSSDVGFFMDMDMSTIRTVIGFDEYATDNNKGYYRRINVNGNKRFFASMPYDQNGRAISDVNNFFASTSTVYRLISPGVVYLLGTRYCILRCDELDDHIHGSRAYGRWSPGIGVLKMFNVNDVAHQRIDFVNFQRKPFHPIGKLDKLSLRFETSDGQLYDFKGANHLLILSIKFYVPSQKQTFENSILNPNYKSDYANVFLGRSIAYKDPTTSEDEEEGVAEFPSRYIKKELKYGHESSENEGEDLTSSSEYDFRTS